MNTVSQPEIIGLDASRCWLDIHCLSDDRQRRLPNTDEGHSKLEKIAVGRIWREVACMFNVSVSSVKG